MMPRCFRHPDDGVRIVMAAIPEFAALTPGFNPSRLRRLRGDARLLYRVAHRTAHPESALRFEDPAAADHGTLDGNGNERRGIFAQGVAAEHNEVGQFSALD